MEEVAVIDAAVKICGLTRLEDVLLAAELGAWALGFVFAPSPRRLTPAEARVLVEAARERWQPSVDPSDRADATPDRTPLTVGVFTDASPAEIAEVVATVGLDAVQLHRPGGPGAPGAAAVRKALRGPSGPTERPAGAPLIIQAVPVAADESEPGKLIEAVAAAREDADLVLLDTKASGRFGGTGAAFPWSLARAVANGRPLLVAGGIGPDNVWAAIHESGAWGVDVSSGIELSPGVKDSTALRRLFASARPSTGRTAQ